jgi:nucleoside-triphosphatase THEP1
MVSQKPGEGVMIEGLWTVEFRSSMARLGFGTIIFDRNRVVGGDDGYYYIGTYEVDGDTIKGVAKIKKYNAAAVSIFGPLEIFDVEISGPVNDTMMTLTGSVVKHPEMRLSVICTKRENL